MGWAASYIHRLQAGETVSFCPRGHSMTPRIRSGQRCTVAPVNPDDLQVGDIVLCRVRGREYLHFVRAVRDGRFQIGNNHGGINGWIGAGNVFGRLIKVASSKKDDQRRLGDVSG